MQVFGGKVTGSSHEAKGLPCQDAFRFEKTDFGTVIIAVADGLGSAENSDIGADIAVNSAVKRIKSLFEEHERYEVPAAALMKNRDIIREAFYSARESLETYAKTNGLQLKTLACTLIVAFNDGDFLNTGHIGDGAVTADTGGKISIVSTPADSEYVNEVTPLTSGNIDENLRINENVPKTGIFAVFTDGCQRAFLKRTPEGYIPYEPFFRPLFSYLAELSDEDEGSGQIENFLASEKMADNSDDDKTLVIAVLKGRTGENDT